ncbi:MAG: hypothetical protein MSIBF_01655 [Candidatus Altiarchaeales archaeon IMC4]|nr:MAG: hypothetical protein MSIBF_01655 [Candidatus Altiarchaeales archaeon IMC4]
MKMIEEKKVSELMTHGTVSVPLDDTVADVVRVLAEGRVHGVVVTSKTGEAVGVISEIDIVKALGRDFNKIKVQEIMTPDVVFVSPQMSVKEAAGIMAQKHISRLFVVDEKKRPRGVFSITDLINEIEQAII